MNKILFTLLLLSIIPITVSTQPPPGYLGKRASVLFNFASFPAILGPTQNNRGITDAGFRFEGSEKGLAFNYEFNLEFSYVVGRMRSLSFNVGQYYTGALTETNTLPVGNSDPNNFFNQDEHSLFNRVNVRSIGLMYKKFNPIKGGLAPVGNHWAFGLKYLFINSEIVDKRTRFNSSAGAILGHRPLDLDNKTSFLLFKIAFHNTNIIKDRILIKSGFQIGIPIHRFVQSIGKDVEELYNTGNEDEKFYDYEFPIFRRIFYHELLRFDIGVGFLLF